VGVGDGGDGVLPAAHGAVAEKAGAQGPALLHGPVGEHDPPRDVPHGKYPGNAGFLPVVDGDAPAVMADSRPGQGCCVEAGPPPRAEKGVFRLEFHCLPIFYRHGAYPVPVFPELLDLRRRMDLHAEAGQFLLEEGSGLFLLIGEDGGEDLHDPDGDAQLRQKGGEFHPDDAAADDHHAFGQGGKPEEGVGGQDPRRGRKDRRRFGTPGNDDAAGPEAFGFAVGRRADHLAGDGDPSLPGLCLHACPFQGLLHPQSGDPDRLVPVATDRGKIIGRRAGGDAHPGELLQGGVMPAARQEGLGGDAAPMGARPSPAVFLDDGHPGAVARRLLRDGVTAGAAADDDKVKTFQ